MKSKKTILSFYIVAILIATSLTFSINSSKEKERSDAPASHITVLAADYEDDATEINDIRKDENTNLSLISSKEIKNVLRSELIHTQDENIDIQSSNSAACFVRFPTITDLIADAELIVTGKALSVYSYIEQEGFFKGSISSNVEFQIDDVLKGEPDDRIINVLSQGGMLSRYDFFLGNEELFKIKMSEEDFIEAKQNVTKKRNTAYTEEYFDGIDYIHEGDNLLLFLSYDIDNDYYYIVSTTRFGKLDIDSRTQQIYRTFAREDSITIMSDTLIENDEDSLTLSDIYDLTEITDDNSENRLQQRLDYRAAQEELQEYYDTHGTIPEGTRITLPNK